MKHVIVIALVVLGSRGMAQNGCGNTLTSSSPTCQVLGSGTVSSGWTVVSRHGEYNQSETECNIPSAITQASSTLTFTTSHTSYSCGAFNPCTLSNPSVNCATSAQVGYSSNPLPTGTPASWPYTTGDIQWSSLNFRYGTVIARIQMPNSNTSLWPAMWLLGSNCQNSNIYSGDPGASGCPNLGATGYIEIDFPECYSGSCQYHVANPSFGIGGGCDGTFTWDTSYHLYGITWTSSSIVFREDGTTLSTCNQSIAAGNMFLIAQIQTGGTGGTPVNGNLPASMNIDYIKVCNSTMTYAQCNSAATNDPAVIFYDDFTGAAPAPPTGLTATPH